MKFKRVIRGYDPKEVDRYLVETAAKEQEIRAAQKERIDELLEENRSLRKLTQQYRADEQAISKSLIDSHTVAEDIKREAERYSEREMLRAKIFCASWRAYSKTMIASLTDEEVRSFNFLQRKIESLVAEYDKKEVKEVAAAEAKSEEKRGFSNPISRIEGFSEQVIDLKELINPEQSLEEICAELGIIKK